MYVASLKCAFSGETALSMKIVLLGAPGVGKGTVGRILCERHHLPYISTGDVFRGAVASGSPLGKKVKAILDSGALVPDDVTNEVVRERLSEPDCEYGFLLDGYPRTIPQAEFLKSILGGDSIAAVFNLELAESEIIARLSSRRVCPKCKATYNLQFHPPVKAGVCDACGTPIVQRSDDAPAVIRTRIQVYEKQTKPLVDFYRKQGLLHVFDAKGTPEETVRMLEAKMEKLGIGRGSYFVK